MTEPAASPPPPVAVLIVAAGRGERVGTSQEGPKQYRRIGGAAMLRHTVDLFLKLPQISAVHVVIHPDDQALCESALGDRLAKIGTSFGGATRQDSVRLGLEALAASKVDATDAVVLIHDAARPFTSVETIVRTIQAVSVGVGVLPALPLTDTIKRSEAGLVSATLDRSTLFAAQTPQGFRLGDILDAHRSAARTGDTGFTDDASIAEWHGLQVRLVAGDPGNVKITTAHDLALARARLEEPAMIDVRAGNGYDVHRLVAGDHVTLCGVRIPHDQALDGHSDADVGLHALTDALLATCGAGDIGDHFPPSDPQWRGAPSRIFVEHAARIVAAAGGRICNADISLICEAPKVAPHRQAMREAIAAMLGLSLDRVSVKATTNETIGFVGRREGIAAIATASVAFDGKDPRP